MNTKVRAIHDNTAKLSRMSVKVKWKELSPEDRLGEYHVWFMFDNHTFHGVAGTLDHIEQTLRECFAIDPYGGWGRLMKLSDYKKEPDNEELQLVRGLQFDMEWFEDGRSVSDEQQTDTGKVP